MTPAELTARGVAEPLPCPFCGGPPRTFQYDGATQVSCSNTHPNCAGTDVVAPIVMWNRRATPTALASPSGVEALAALRAELDGLLTTWAESRERHLKAEAEAADLRARLAAAEALVARLVGELASLDKSASEVLRLGAVTGSQWTRLNIASLKARAALASAQGVKHD